MVDPFSNIEETFKNAFEHWDAPHSPAEMNGSWQQVSAHLPQAPAPHAGASAGQAAGHVASGIGKIIGLGGLGAAAVTAGVILYHVHTKPLATSAKYSSTIAAQTEQTATAQKTAPNPVAVPKQQSTAMSAHNGNRISATGIEGTAKNNISPFVMPNLPQGQPSLPQAPNNAANQGTGPVKTSPMPNPNPALRLILSDTVVCRGIPITVSANMPATGNILSWGDGKLSDFSGQNNHAYAFAGQYKVHLEQNSPNLIAPDRYVTVIDAPKAKFTVHLSGKSCELSNESKMANSYTWSFGDASANTSGFYANHTYEDTGKYKVSLVATSSNGCADTMYQYLVVQQIVLPKLSGNALTPNGDGIDDDVWVMNTDGLVYFQLTIMDRSGKIVFQGNDPSQHWNGKNQKTGMDCPSGSYFYNIIYRSKQGGAQQPLSGSIYLTR